MNESTKQKLREKALGRLHSKETKEKMSRKRMGKSPWNKGIKGLHLSPNTEFVVGQNVGSKHPKWKGGVSRAYRTGYYSIEYKEWRKSVFKRDGYACRGCGDIGYITAHHIKSFSHYPKLRYDIDNGLTLCEKCHSATDNYKGRAVTVNKLNEANSVKTPTEISGQRRAKSTSVVNV